MVTLKDLLKALGYKSLLNIYKMNIPKEFIYYFEGIIIDVIPSK